MAPTYSENEDLRSFGSYSDFSDEELDHDDELQEVQDELEALQDEVEEPVKQDTTEYTVKKIRGGKVSYKGEDFPKNGETYDVSEEVYKFLINLRDGYGRPYFEPA